MRPFPALTLAIALCAAATMARAAEPQTDEQKALYALGVAMSQNLSSFSLTDAELEFVKAGIADGAKGKTPPGYDPQPYFAKLQEMQTTRSAAAGKAVLDKAAAEKGAKRTASGIVITTIKEGTGASPKATDTVKVHYHGTLPNGKVFDSSRQRGEPVDYVAELLSGPRLAAAGYFEPAAVAKLFDKCRSGRAIGFADNMAFVAVLSTMLLHDQFIAGAASRRPASHARYAQASAH